MYVYACYRSEADKSFAFVTVNVMQRKKFHNQYALARLGKHDYECVCYRYEMISLCCHPPSPPLDPHNNDISLL